MRAPWIASLLLLGVVTLAACDESEDESGGEKSSGGERASGGKAGSASGGAGGDAAAALEPCLERPNDLPRPPAGRLPCELLPPQFAD